MDFKLITDTENKLFNRREIEGEIHADSAPSRQEVAKIISEKISVNPDVIKIKTIKGKFGEKVFLVVANIYKSKEDMDKVELKKKKDIETEKKEESAEKVEKTEEKKEEKSEEELENKESLNDTKEQDTENSVNKVEPDTSEANEIKEEKLE